MAVANQNDGSYATDSTIYKWNGSQFEEFQAIPTNAGSDWASFEINGETYLAVANFLDPISGSRNVDSVIYKWDGSQFTPVQSIATHGATEWESFQINGETYLALANSYNDTTYNIDSVIYKWNGSQFAQVQAIPTSAASDWESFQINGETYLAVANSFNGSSFNINSVIYKWDGSQFAEVQAIPTSNAIDWQSFRADGETYLAVANNWNGSSNDINSAIYKWNGSQFIQTQSIPTHGNVKRFVSGRRGLALPGLSFRG